MTWAVRSDLGVDGRWWEGGSEEGSHRRFKREIQEGRGRVRDGIEGNASTSPGVGTIVGAGQFGLTEPPPALVNMPI